MKYTYKCGYCDTEREVEHSVAECDTHEEMCFHGPTHHYGEEGKPMLRVIQPSLIIWKGGKPSET